MGKIAQTLFSVDCRLRNAAILSTAIAATLLVLAPFPVAAAEKRRPESQATVHTRKEDCFITDPNGRKWPCSRLYNPAEQRTAFHCPVENRLSAQMNLYCESDADVYDMGYILGPGDTEDMSYYSVYDPAPLPNSKELYRTSPNVTCWWWCDGNTMNDVVVWNEQWPEAWSCREDGGDGQCRLVFESNREVVLVTRTGRRVLGDIAIKECSKNLGGYGGWLPFGLGCTYPKHDHEYYGTIG
ncbi:hypothetical protein QOZ80_8AG0626990 [Eleusine coracana subsp. coracana]|nr:hypothetical protein QOZ80_8AG0626990 [Eleusine coracana subsp. coracana]